MVWRFIIPIWISFSCHLFHNVLGACTFPDEITGVWYSAHKGALTFNSTTLTGYPIYMSVAVQQLDFTCEEKSGYRYMLKSTTSPLVFGSFIRAYLCIKLSRVSAHKYIYYMGTSVSATNNDNVYGREMSYSVTMKDVCNVAEPYAVGSFIVLVKEASIYNGLALASNPNGLLAKFNAVTITFSSGTTCTGNTYDGCSDRTYLQYNYQSCASGNAFNGDGLLFSMHSVNNGEYTYLSVWNNDTTVDGTTTFRFICYVIRASGSTTYATEYPNYCKESSQTSTSVPSPGIKLVFSSQTESCKYIKESASYWIFILIILFGVALTVFTTALLLYHFKCGGLPCCRKMNKRVNSADSTLSVVNELFNQNQRRDRNSRTSFRIKQSKPPLDGKRKWGTFLGPVVEANMIQPLPKVEPLYALKNYRTISAISRKDSAASIFDFKYKN